MRRPCAAGHRSSSRPVPQAWPSTLLALALILALAIASRSVAAWAIPARNDEIYHFIAARSWLNGDGFAMADGVYSRARLFTMLVGSSMAAFGDTLLASRIPSIVCGSLTAAGMYLWVRRHCGTLEAWIAALMFATATLAVTIGSFARFYALHALLFWGFAAAVYSLSAQPTGRHRQLAMIAAVPALLLAIHLQVITFIGVLALGVWLLLDALRPGWLRDRFGEARTRAVVGAVAGLGVLLVLLLAVSGLATPYIDRFLESPAWTRHSRGQISYYIRFFLQEYPVLFGLLPVVIAAALARAPRPAFFCTVMLLLPLGLHSLAGMKYPSYVYWLLPPLFVLVALAVASVLVPVATLGARAVERLTGRTAPTWVAPVMMAGTILTLLLSSPGIYATAVASVRALRADDALDRGLAWRSRFVEWEPAWSPARARLLQLMEAADVTITTDELRTLLYIGRPDVLLNASRMTEISNPREFGRDQRTGLPIIAAPASLDTLVRCNRTGLLLRARGGQREGRIPAATEAYIASRLQELPPPPDVPGLRLLGWRHGPDWVPAADCMQSDRLWKKQ